MRIRVVVQLEVEVDAIDLKTAAAGVVANEMTDEQGRPPDAERALGFSGTVEHAAQVLWLTGTTNHLKQVLPAATMNDIHINVTEVLP